MKVIIQKIKYWYEYKRPASFWDWVLDMDDNHAWFRPLVQILSSLVGVAIGLSLFALILFILHR